MAKNDESSSTQAADDPDLFASADEVNLGRAVYLSEKGGEEMAKRIYSDPQAALDAADDIRRVALLAMTHRASAIAEEKALVGSAAHHYDRGATGAFHYDRRVAQAEGPPLQAAVPDVNAQAIPEFEPGNSPVTGTSEESNEAIDRMLAQAPQGGVAPLPSLEKGGAEEGAAGGPPGTVSPEPPGDGGGDGETAKDKAARVGEMSDDELSEAANDDRVTVQKAVEAEQARRAKAAEEES